MINIKEEEKVTALIMHRASNEFKILAFEFIGTDYPYHRLPGGGVEQDESIENAVYREIREESGIGKSDLVYMRKVGELRYYKPITGKKVHMHHFLFLYNSNKADDFVYTVQSDGKDDGIKLKYTWLRKNEINKIDPELSQLFNPYNLPEFFLKPSEFGLKNKQLKLTHTSKEWKRIYEFEEIQIREKLNYKVVVHHIGSTALSDFIAKPIIDIVLEFVHEQDITNSITRLEEIGYTYHGPYGIDERYYFTKGTTDTTYFHVHGFKTGAKQIKEHLKIYDTLNNNMDYKNKYAQYKLEHIHDKREKYTTNKNELLNEIINLKS